MHTIYFKYGAKSLLFCKFVPGLGTLGPPMAGMMKLPPSHFLAFDAAGALLWSGAYVAIGWMFQAQIEALAAGMVTFGTWFAIALASIIFFYASWKYIKRRRFYHSLRIAEITPYELRQRIDAGEKLVVIDLRNPTEWREGRIPGSLQFEQSQLDQVIPAIAQAEAVLYCSCRHEADSARAALWLKRRGVRRVRPLEGGFERWLELGFPVEQYAKFKTV
jgi:rhodanese-related sulfurtransferase